MAPEENTSSNAYAFSKLFCQSLCLKPCLSSRVGTRVSAWMQIQQRYLPMLWSCKKRYWKKKMRGKSKMLAVVSMPVMLQVTCWNLMSGTIVLKARRFCQWVLGPDNHVLLPGSNAPVAAIRGIRLSTAAHENTDLHNTFSLPATWSRAFSLLQW